MQPKKRLAVMLVRWAAGMSLVWAALIGAAGLVGSVAPDRQFLAYTHYEAGEPMPAYLLRDLDTCIEHRMALPVTIGSMAWSPDGEQIAFISGVEFTGEINLYVMDWNGRNVRFLNDLPDFHVPLSWMPDSSAIVYTALNSEYGSNVYATNPLTGDTHTLLDEPADIADYVLSPDGQYAAYRQDRKIMLIRLADGVETRIESETSFDYSPQWSQDSREVFFSSQAGTFGELNVYSLDRAETTRLRSQPNVGQWLMQMYHYDSSGRLLLIIPSDELWERVGGHLSIMTQDRHIEPMPCRPPRADYVTMRP